MTSDLFEEWVRELDRKLQREDKKIALIVDNCPAHPDINDLKAIELVFLPPNTTSHTQPMDQGVIWSLKSIYIILSVSQSDVLLPLLKMMKICHHLAILMP